MLTDLPCVPQVTKLHSSRPLRTRVGRAHPTLRSSQTGHCRGLVSLAGGSKLPRLHAEQCHPAKQRRTRVLLLRQAVGAKATRSRLAEPTYATTGLRRWHAQCTTHQCMCVGCTIPPLAEVLQRPFPYVSPGPCLRKHPPIHRSVSRREGARLGL